MESAYQTTRRHVPDESNPDTNHRRNLKFLLKPITLFIAQIT
jgi:hypothetical protein